MTKDELISRLQVLGEQMKRYVSLKGTQEELVPLLAEVAEEHEEPGHRPRGGNTLRHGKKEVGTKQVDGGNTEGEGGEGGGGGGGGG
ncbi:DNA-packaging protein FI, partial [Escherichia coli]|uniref:DNA-packaging protein FI n=1 Tax=Escherichia coli TaxID=562 RepID=UPI001BDB7D1D